MNYKIVNKNGFYCICVEMVRDDRIIESQFTIPASGDFSLLLNSLKMCGETVYQEWINTKEIKEYKNDQLSKSR